MKTHFAIIFFLIAFSISSIAQMKVDSTYYLPRKFTKPTAWKMLDQQRLEEDGEYFSGKYSDTLKLPGALTIICTEKDFIKFLGAKSWCIKYYKAAFPYLVDMLTDTTTVGLTNANDLIVSFRNLPFSGNGDMINEDIFTVAGRASFILNELTGEKFARVQPQTKMVTLRKFKTAWADWIKNLK